MPSRKELNHFNRFDFQGAPNGYYSESNAKLASYFSGAEGRDLRGEFSPQYFTDATALERIAREQPQAKIIIALRDPVKRFLSHLQYDQSFNRIIPEELSVDQAMEQHPYLVEQGDYAAGVRAWLHHFPSEQIFVFQLEKAIAQPEEFTADLFAFLGLDTRGVAFDFSPSNERKQVKSATIYALLALPGKIDKWLVRFGWWRGLRNGRWYAALLQWRWSQADKNVQAIETPLELTESAQRILNERYCTTWEDVAGAVGASRWI